MSISLFDELARDKPKGTEEIYKHPILYIYYQGINKAHFELLQIIPNWAKSYEQNKISNSEQDRSIPGDVWCKDIDEINFNLAISENYFYTNFYLKWTFFWRFLETEFL